MEKRYMAYVGSYSYLGKAKGITCYDVDVKKGSLKQRCEVEVDNSSYVICSHGEDRLYSIADEGVVSFRILPNGTLQRLGSVKINGMRGCHLSISPDDRYICVSGYHDGKMTILEVNQTDGTIGKIKYEVYNTGYGSIAERNYRPHVTCTRFTPDCRYILSCDSGIDQIKIYRCNPQEEELRQVDAIRCERGSSPKFFRISPDGKFMYLIYEIKNVIEVYSYDPGERAPVFEKIQTIGTTSGRGDETMCAACAIRITPDGKHVLVSNAGENTVTIFDRDTETGLLTVRNSLPISGDYPKDISLFPDARHLAVANHSSNEITLFKIDFENGLLVMSGRSVPVNQPNCIRFIAI